MGKKPSKPETPSNILAHPSVQNVETTRKPRLVEHRQKRGENVVRENPFYIPNLNDEDCENILKGEKEAFLFRDSCVEGELIFSFITKGREIGKYAIVA